MSVFSRRTVLRSALLGAAAVSTPALLTACGSSGGGGSVGTANGKLAPWPAYVPFAGPKPDLPGNEAGVQPAYFQTPPADKLTKSVNGEAPGDGSTVRAMVISFTKPPTPLESNPFWQYVNKLLNIKLEVTVVPEADYAQKMATLMAGGDLPDLLLIASGSYVLPREAEFVASQCADLTEHLSGDAVKKYPNLANIPTYAWKGMGQIRGGLYGVPIERPRAGTSLIVNRDAFTAAGIDDATWDKDDFLAAAKKLTHDKSFGLGASNSRWFGYDFHAAAFGAPNEWKVEGGKFVTAYGTEEFKAALAFMRQLHEAGVYHPDAMSTSQIDMKSAFYNKTVATMPDGFGGFYQSSYENKGAFTVDIGLPYAGAGSNPGGAWGSKGLFGYTVMKKAPKERIEMLLRVLNYLAAPFGSQEELALRGIEGRHWERDAEGRPINKPATPGMELVGDLGLGYLAYRPQIIFNINLKPEGLTRAHTWQGKVMPVTIANPATGLKSEAESRNGVALKKLITDGVVAVVTGRQPLSDWDALVSKWKVEGGDKMAEEFAKQYGTQG